MIELLEDRLRATMKAVATATAIPPPPAAIPAPTDRPRSWQRKAFIGVGAIGAVVAVGIPAASGAGVLPAIAAAFGWSQSGPVAAEQTTGHLLLTLPGPDGHPMRLYEATAADGGHCLTMFLPDAPKRLQVAEASCTAKGASPQDVEPGASASSEAGTYMTLYGASAAYLTLSDGITTRRFPVVDGVSEAWLPALDFNRTLTLAGFSSTGEEVGHFTFTHRPPTQPQPTSNAG